MSWTCIYNPPVVEVNGRNVDYAWGGFNDGVYELLPEIHCHVCATPESTFDCTNHYDLYGFKRIYALGKYIAFPWNHFLSSHIRFLKREYRFKEPLGLALSLVVQNRYTELLKSDVLIPVPMHDSKLEERGFNQAEQLAQEFNKYVKKSFFDCLTQIKPLELRPLSREERFKAVKGAFDFQKEYFKYIENKKVILIDDVVTTGATASECSKVLRDNGASQIDVLILGRTCDE